MPSKKEQDREEIARRGDAIYDRKVRDAVSEEKKGQFVAIDVRSEDFEIDADDRTATKRLRTLATLRREYGFAASVRAMPDASALVPVQRLTWENERGNRQYRSRSGY